MYEAWKAKHQVEANGDRIKLPSLGEGITDRRLDRMRNTQHQKIKRDQLEDAHERRLDRLFQTKEAEHGLGEIREVCAKRHQRNHQPACGGRVHATSGIKMTMPASWHRCKLPSAARARHQARRPPRHSMTTQAAAHRWPRSLRYPSAHRNTSA